MNILEYLKSISRESIARRYFLMNSFDGSLTIFGIILALQLAGSGNPKVILISCLGAAIALAVSGVWSAYAAEKAERLREMKTLERHILRDLDDTRIERQLNSIVLKVTLVNGLSPFIAVLVIISPYIASQLGLLSADSAFTLSLIFVATILFSLGVIAGSISEDDKLGNGVKMLSAGVVVAVITILLEAVRVI